jgi:hypothetical protein
VLVYGLIVVGAWRKVGGGGGGLDQYNTIHPSLYQSITSECREKFSTQLVVIDIISIPSYPIPFH